MPSKYARNHDPMPYSGIADPPHHTESSMWLPIHLLEVLCERVPVGIALYDRTMSLRHCNPAWVKMIARYTRTSAEEVKPGTHLIDLIPETDAPIHTAFTRVLQGETITVDGLRLQACDRVSYWDMTFSPLPENNGVGEVMVIAIESTERVLTHRELDHHVVMRTRELTALHDVMAAANRFSDPERVIAHSLERVLDVIACEIGAIHLLDREQQTLRLAASQGIDAVTREKIAAVDVEQGLAGLTVDRGVPLVLSSIAEGSRPLLALPGNSSQPYVGVPLRAKDQALGVLSVIGSQGRAFTDEEITLLVAIADGIGTALENARLRHHAEQLAVMRERERLARELHDSVTQSLYSLTLLAEAGQRLARDGNLGRVREHIVRLGDIAQQALREMRLLVYQLRPPILAQEGLAGALQRRLDAVEKRAGVEATFIVEGAQRLPEIIEEGLYGIAQEALNNAIKHAGANQIQVSLRIDEHRATLEIVDDGRGFDTGAVTEAGGLGLISMRERAESLAGTLTVNSKPEQGTRVKVEIDLKDIDTSDDDPLEAFL